MEQDTSADAPNKTYEYTAIEGERTVRLIVLESGEFDDDIVFRLDHVSLDGNPQYEALSYAWGDVSVTSDIFDKDGSRLGIGQSMRFSSHWTSFQPQIDKTIIRLVFCPSLSSSKLN